MNTLKQRLDRIRESFSEKAPDEAKAVMHRATEELGASGILDRIPSVGDTLAPFELPDTEDNVVSSAELLAQGPLVLTFYRGLW